MSQLSLAAGATPAFLSENYLNRAALEGGDLVATTGQDFVQRLFDFDRAATWGSIGSDDTITETIEFGLWDRDAVIARDVDFVALWGHNLLRFKVEYKLGAGSWTIVPGADFTSSDFPGSPGPVNDLIISLGSTFNADRIRLTMTRTQVADEEKQIGFITIGEGKFQPARGLTLLDYQRPETAKDVIMADGSIDSAFVYRSDLRFDFYRARMGFRAMDSADRDQFIALKNAPPFMVLPEPGDKPDEIFQARFAPGTFKDGYTSFRGVGKLFDITFDLEEIGGA